jgi:hypothetical protein
MLFDYSQAMQSTPRQDRPPPESRDALPPREVDRGWRTVRIGIIVLCVAVLVVLSPLVARYPLDRFVVFAGLLAACIGVSCVILGALDRVMK